MPEHDVKLDVSLEKLRLLWSSVAIGLDYLEQPESSDLHLLLRLWRDVTVADSCSNSAKHESILCLDLPDKFWSKVLSLGSRRLSIVDRVFGSLVGCQIAVGFARSRYDPVDR